MDNQNTDFEAAYGRTMFYAHLIEDLLARHVFECGHYHVNGYAGHSRSQIRKMTHEKRINELSEIYSEQDDTSIQRLKSGLHLLRKIRNKLTHAIVVEVGKDFSSEEGRDQIMGMLSNIEKWERGHYAILTRAHEAVLNGVLTQNPLQILDRVDPPFDPRVSESKIQKHLEELDSLFDGDEMDGSDEC